MDLGKTRQELQQNGALLALKSGGEGEGWVTENVIFNSSKSFFHYSIITNERACERLRHRALS